MKKIIVLLFVLLLPITAYASKQDELNAVNEEIKQLQNEQAKKNEQLSMLNKNILQLDNQIAQIQNKIANTQRQIDEVQVKINENTIKLEKKQKEIDELISALEDRVRVMSKIKPMDYIQIIFSSRNIKDFFSNYTIIKKIIEQDKNNINKLQIAKKELLIISEELNNFKNNLNNLKKDYTLQNDSLSMAKKEQEKNLASLEKDLASLEQIENQKIQEAADIADEIRRMTVQSSYQGSYKGGILGPPLASLYVTSPYGYRIHPVLGYKKMHTGVDFGASSGTPIYASEDGVVLHAGPKSTYGNTVMIDHGAGIVTLYAHCSSVATYVGQTVKKGQVIAYVGSTGRSTGPHLHFEVRVNGAHTNPMNYL